MNKQLTLLGLCSLIISNSYSMQQPPAKNLTYEERKERAERAYRACQRSYHLKCAARYEETTETKQVDNEKCEFTRHVTCMKVAQEKFTEGFFEEFKEFFTPKK